MEPWLQFATDYIRDWLEFQFKSSQQPGCIFAIAHRDKVIAEHAFGQADLDTQERLTSRHRFRNRIAFKELHLSRGNEAARAA
jgi:hypothetical protein